jgi:hypothetical protein
VASSVGTKAVQQSVNQNATATEWARQFLVAVGAPVTQNNIDNIIAWGNIESGPPGSHRQTYGGWDGYNPLNVVRQTGDNSLPGNNSAGVVNFATFNDGVQSSARLFLGSSGTKQAIIAALRANAPTATLGAAINNFYASWGSGFSFSGSAPTGGNQPIGSGTSDVAGGVATGAQLDAYIPGTNIHIPGTGAGGKILPSPLSWMESLASFVLNIGDNWRYIVEVIAGAMLMLTGVGLIAIDIVGKNLSGNAGAIAAAGAKAL